MRAQWKHHVDLGTNALHETPDFSHITGRVEGAVAWTNDIHPGSLTVFANALGDLFKAVLTPEPRHGPVGTLPLVFVDGSGQKPHQIGALRGHTATDHLGNGARHHHRGQIRVQTGVGAFHGAFGAFTTELLLGQTGHHNG